MKHTHIIIKGQTRCLICDQQYKIDKKIVENSKDYE